MQEGIFDDKHRMSNRDRLVKNFPYYLADTSRVLILTTSSVRIHLHLKFLALLASFYYLKWQKHC